MHRFLRLASAFTILVTICLCGLFIGNGGLSCAFNAMVKHDETGLDGVHALSDSLANEGMWIASWLVPGVLLTWVILRYRTSVSFQGKQLADILQDDAHEVCASAVVLFPFSAPLKDFAWRISGLEDWVVDTLCKTSGHLGIFIGIVYSLDQPDSVATNLQAIPRATGSQTIVRLMSSVSDMNTRKRLVLSPTSAGLVTRVVRQTFLGSQGVFGVFSINSLVSAYQWAYYSPTAPLDPDAFDMAAYLATPIKLYSLLGPSFAEPTAHISLGSLAVHDLLSAYCYATYPVRRLLSVVLGLETDDNLSTGAALALYCPELLVSRTSTALRLSSSVLYWLNESEREPGPEDVSTARIEELDYEQDTFVVLDVQQHSPALMAPDSSFGFFSIRDLLAAFNYACNPVRSRTIDVRFACNTLRVVHRNKCADINVHVFNERTRARLLTLVENPPESFRSPRAFARVASDATTTTEGSSDADLDSDFPYTDSDFDFDFGALHLGGSDLDSDLDCDEDEEMEEMTWMLDELSVDDYPSLYGWELEALVRALRALTIDELVLLGDEDLEDARALLRMLGPDGSLGLNGSDAGSLQAALVRLLADNGNSLLGSLGFDSSDLATASSQVSDDSGSERPPASVLRDVLARLRSRRHASDTNDLLAKVLRTDETSPASPWKGKGKARALDDLDLTLDLDLDESSRNPGLSALQLPCAQPGSMDADSEASSDDAAPLPAMQKKKRRHRGGKRIPMAERRRRARQTFQDTMAALRDVEFVEGPSWVPDDEKWCEGFGMW